MVNISASNRIKYNRGFRSNKKSNCSSSSCRSSISLIINSNIRTNCNCKSSIPWTTFNPWNWIKYSIGSTVTSINACNSFYVMITNLFEELHQNCLGWLTLIKKSFSSYFESSNRLWVDIIFFKQILNNC